MFIRYPHLEKYGNDSVDGINIGKTYVFPKIDGTNASVWLEDKQIKAGSRNRELTVENDNAGFYKWVLQNKTLEKFLHYYPQFRLYGEWLVPHTITDYREDAWNKFYVFDVYNDQDGQFLSYENYKILLDHFNIEYIPCWKIINNGTLENYLREAEQCKYLLKQDQDGEGIVIKNYGFINKYNKVTWAKIVNSEFKEQNYKIFGSPEMGKQLIEQEIVDSHVTQAFCEKEYAKLKLDGWNSKRIPELLGKIWHALITEELWDIIKQHKDPKIDFKFLRNLTIQKIKQTLPEVF